MSFIPAGPFDLFVSETPSLAVAGEITSGGLTISGSEAILLFFSGIPEGGYPSVRDKEL